MRSRDRDALVDRFRRFDSAIEIGIGARTDVAEALAERGVAVTATDVLKRSVPRGVTFVLDDVTDPDRAVYEDADLLYAINLPGELHRPVADLASDIEAECAFTTFSVEGPALPATAEGIGGDTLYWVGDGEQDH